jgi:hypothetical protein
LPPPIKKQRKTRSAFAPLRANQTQANTTLKSTSKQPKAYMAAWSGLIRVLRPALTKSADIVINHHISQRFGF